MLESAPLFREHPLNDFRESEEAVLRSFSFGLRLVCVLIVLCGISTISYGSGFSIFEQGAKASGMGGAFTATADDPSAMFYNVAGIAYQRKLAGMMGATLITFGNEFEGDPATEFPGAGVDGSYEHHSFIIPTTYVVIPIGENITFGLGQFTAFGLRTHWQDENRFPGRFISQDANLKTASVQPSLAFKMMGDRLALGVGLEYRTSHISLERNNAAVNPFTGRIVDVAHIRLNSDWNSAYGVNVGLIFKPAATLSVGASYRSAMDIDYEGDATFTQISTGNAQLDAIVRAGLPPNQSMTTTLPFPAFTHVGVATTVIPNWQVAFDVDHTSWSRFKELLVEFEQNPERNLSAQQNWENTLSYRLGGNHPVTPNWDVRLGAVYDENPQPDEAVGPLLPDSDRLGVSFGLGFHNDHWRVDATDMVLHFYDRSTFGQNADNFNGTYKTSANLFSLNLGYTF